MRIVCALDVHRSQITYLTVEVGTGEVSRGRISPATRQSVRAWLARFDGVDEVHFALEGTTGWRFVVEEIERAGHRPHLADPAETAARRGRKRRAKTDRTDCDLQLRLLLAGELPESWIPPAQILELRTRVRLRKALVDERTAWQQRLQAQLFHQGAPAGLKPRTRGGREALARAELSPAGRELVALALRMIDRIDLELAPLDRTLSLFAWDAGSARVLEALGFRALATTSSGFAFTLGRLDGAATLDEVCAHIGALDRATGLPVSADLENGYGASPEQAAHAVARAAEAGAVGGSIEDWDPSASAAEAAVASGVPRLSEAAPVCISVACRRLPFARIDRARRALRAGQGVGDSRTPA